MRTLAVIHPTSLVGKELRERLEARPDLCRELRLLSADEDEVGTLTESAGAAAFVGRVEPESFHGVDLVFLCGGIAGDRKALAEVPKSIPAIVLSHGATGEDGTPAIAGLREDELLGAHRLVSPHPAAVGVGLLLGALAPLAPRRAVATVVQPVSTAGEPGMDELLEQTRGILAFSGNPKGKVFPGQIAFNVMPVAGGAAEVAGLVVAATGADYPVDVEVVQGGIFHSMAISLWVELAEGSEAADVRKRLARPAEVAAVPVKELQRLGPVAAANDDRLLLGAVRAAGRPGAYWIWAAMDNLVRGGALNALGLAERLLNVAPPA